MDKYCGYCKTTPCSCGLNTTISDGATVPSVVVELACCPVCGSDLVAEEENKVLKAKVEKLKGLLFLTDTVVSSVEMNQITTLQIQEYLKAFPDEEE